MCSVMINQVNISRGFMKFKHIFCFSVICLMANLNFARADGEADAECKRESKLETAEEFGVGTYCSNEAEGRRKVGVLISSLKQYMRADIMQKHVKCPAECELKEDSIVDHALNSETVDIGAFIDFYDAISNEDSFFASRKQAFMEFCIKNFIESGSNEAEAKYFCELLWSQSQVGYLLFSYQLKVGLTWECVKPSGIKRFFRGAGRMVTEGGGGFRIGGIF